MDETFQVLDMLARDGSRYFVLARCLPPSKRCPGGAVQTVCLYRREWPLATRFATRADAEGSIPAAQKLYQD